MTKLISSGFALISFLASLLFGLPSAGAFEHSPSGIIFPDTINKQFTLKEPQQTDKLPLRVSYTMENGFEVVVVVEKGSKEAVGPSGLRDASEGTAAFKKKFAQIKEAVATKATKTVFRGDMKIQAAGHKKGPIGMRATYSGKLQGSNAVFEVILFAVNDCYVQINLWYSQDKYLECGLKWIDVLNGIKWPKSK